MKPIPEKTCAIVLRQHRFGTHILAFHHPLAETQLVKGTIESSETPEQTALRELREVSGLHSTRTRYLSTTHQNDSGPTWHLVRCHVVDPPDHWNHFRKDDGGQLFKFFWHPLAEPPDQTWQPLFHEPLAMVRHLT